MDTPVSRDLSRVEERCPISWSHPPSLRLPDHYAGITENWAGYPIYCSDVTARFLVHSLGVNPTWVHALALDTPTLINGVQVTLIDANHCPGAVQFLFRLQDGRRFVHCGTAPVPLGVG